MTILTVFYVDSEGDSFHTLEGDSFLELLRGVRNPASQDRELARPDVLYCRLRSGLGGGSRQVRL